VVAVPLSSKIHTRLNFIPQQRFLSPDLPHQRIDSERTANHCPEKRRQGFQYQKSTWRWPKVSVDQLGDVNMSAVEAASLTEFIGA
jgi:hypothetical protein